MVEIVEERRGAAVGAMRVCCMSFALSLRSGSTFWCCRSRPRTSGISCTHVLCSKFHVVTVWAVAGFCVNSTFEFFAAIPGTQETHGCVIKCGLRSVHAWPAYETVTSNVLTYRSNRQACSKQHNKVDPKVRQGGGIGEQGWSANRTSPRPTHLHGA